MQPPRSWRWGALAFTTLCVGAGGALLSRLHQGQRAFDSRAALAAVRNFPTLRASRSLRTGHLEIHRFDQDHDLVLVSLHGRLLAQALVDRADQVTAWQQSNLSGPAYGSTLIFSHVVLLGLVLLCGGALTVRPLSTVRNLDLVAVLLFVVPTYLLERWYVSAAMWSALPSFLYLLVRCSLVAVNPRLAEREACEPLLASLSRRIPVSSRRRLGGLIVTACVVLYACAAFGATTPIDVAYAVMGGATQLIHGVLPYGHDPGGVIHGDTYPILSYAAYIPLALLEPVHSVFDSIQVELLGTAFVAIACGAVLWRRAGWSGALIWLALPLTLLSTSSGTSDIVLGLLILLTVALGRVPLLAIALASAAVWFKLTPIVLLPLLIAGASSRRGLALLIVAALSAACVGLVLAVGGPHGPAAAIGGLRYQLNRSSWQSIWSSPVLLHIRPWAEAAALTVIGWLTLASFRDQAIVREQARLAAAAAAALIAVEIVAPYWTFSYVCWVLPLLAMALFGVSVSRSSAAQDPDGAYRRTVHGARFKFPAQAADDIPA